jgi:hypothetical protein
MQSPTLEAPLVHMVLRAHPPAPARLALAYQSTWLRAVLACGAVVAGVGAAGLSAGFPLRYAWPPLAVAAGLWTARYFWTGTYRVRTFVGLCPACGRHLRLATGTRIRLPYTVACRGCGAGCELRLRVGEASPPAAAQRHFLSDCPGEWRSEWLWDEGFLACTRCGARHAATMELRRLAAAENQHGELLARLAEEGRYL